MRLRDTDRPVALLQGRRVVRSNAHRALEVGGSDDQQKWPEPRANSRALPTAKELQGRLLGPFQQRLEVCSRV